MATPTLDDLLALLPDNTTGDIDAADLREVVSALYARTPYVGQVASDGTLVGGPAGWSSEYDPETNLYTVHHTLGTEAFAVVVTPLTKTDVAQAAMVAATSETSFTYGVWHFGVDALHGTYANFIVGVL